MDRIGEGQTKTKVITMQNGEGRFTGELTVLRLGQFQLISNLTEAPRGWLTDYVWMPTVDIYGGRGPGLKVCTEQTQKWPLLAQLDFHPD